MVPFKGNKPSIHTEAVADGGGGHGVKDLAPIGGDEIGGDKSGSHFGSFGPVRVAQVNGKTEMAGEVQKKLGIELQLRTSFNDHRLDVVIPMSASNPSHLSISLHMTIQKELQTLPRIKPYREVSGVSQNNCKSISHSPRQPLLDPIDLSLLPGKKDQFMVSLPQVRREGHAEDGLRQGRGVRR